MSHPLLFKSLTDLQQILEIKMNFASAKKAKHSKFENEISKKRSETKMLNRQKSCTS